MPTKPSLFLALLCASSLSFLSPQQPVQAHTEAPILTQQVKDWQKSARQSNPSLLNQVRHQVNHSPRHAFFRPALKDLYAAQTQGSAQEQELNYYRLLNLAPQSTTYRNTLAQLLYKKHGGATPAQVKVAYRHLNNAFNRWDEGKTAEALALFKKSQLPKSPELSAIYAYHLRDAGKVAEAKAVIRNFKGDRSYLNWFADMHKEIEAAELVVNSRATAQMKLLPRLHLGQISHVKQALIGMPESVEKLWLQAKFYEKQGQYHPASRAYLNYFKAKMKSSDFKKSMAGYTPIVYKAQLEDVNSLDLIALKFRTSPTLIREVNGLAEQEWVETYRMLIVPVKSHQLKFPTTGYVSSHFGYRLHPIRGTWRLHEGVDIETLAGVPANAASQGTVLMAAYDKACGNMVRLNHADLGIRTVYCHGEKLKVKKGQQVSRGKAVIETGNTGASASNHLHFGVQKNGVYIDPMDWL